MHFSFVIKVKGKKIKQNAEVNKMKNKLMKARPALPFCIPFPFIFLAIDYYSNDELSWIAGIIAGAISVLSYVYYSKEKVLEMLAGDSIGFLASIVITLLMKNRFDEGWFTPLSSMSYVILLCVLVLIIHFLAIALFKLFTKIKSKIRKEK